MVSRFHLTLERNGRTDRRTDLLYQYCASVCWRAIKTMFYVTICNAHRKVTHIIHNYYFTIKRLTFILFSIPTHITLIDYCNTQSALFVWLRTRTLFYHYHYIHGPWGDENILAVYMCHFAMGLTHCYKTIFLNIYVCSFSTKFTLHV